MTDRDPSTPASLDTAPTDPPEGMASLRRAGIVSSEDPATIHRELGADSTLFDQTAAEPFNTDPEFPTTRTPADPDDER